MLCLRPQTIYKITPDFDSVWAEILEADPTGVLVFKKQGFDDLNDSLLRRFAETFSEDAMERVILIPGQRCRCCSMCRMAP